MTTSLAGWMKYLSGPVAGQPDTAAQDFLTRLQQYDPSAHIEAAPGGGDDPGKAGYQIVYNKSALPKTVQGGDPYRELNASGELPGGYILDRSKIYDDPVYGKWIGSDNTREAKKATDTWGPIAVGGLAAAGGLGLLGSGLSGAPAAGAGYGLPDPSSVMEGSGYNPTLGDLSGASDGGGVSPGQPGDGIGSLTDTGGGGHSLGGDLSSASGVADSPGANVFNAAGTGAAGGSGYGNGGIMDQIKSMFPGVDASTLGTLANLLGPVLGGILTKNATSKATDQVLAGIDKAGQQATSLLGGNAALYKPYTDAGPAGVAKLQDMMGNSSLAGNFKPIANQNIAGQFRPLGAGRGLTMGQMARGR